jgi:hypothetical protein
MSPLPAASVPLRGSRSVQAVRTRINFIKGMDRIVTIAKLVAQTLAAAAGVSGSDRLSDLSETRARTSFAPSRIAASKGGSAA